MKVLNIKLNWRGSVSSPLPQAGQSVRFLPQCLHASPPGIMNLLPGRFAIMHHGSSSNLSARKRLLHMRQSTIGSVK